MHVNIMNIQNIATKSQADSLFCKIIKDNKNTLFQRKGLEVAKVIMVAVRFSRFKNFLQSSLTYLSLRRFCDAMPFSSF